nr:ATP-dependent helicase [Pseudomonas sp. A46]
MQDLEKSAYDVVLSKRNCLVVAGPGAGKTELLAQRANFLLSTGECPFPRKVLAISFKRDAAKNLLDRVSKRSDSEAARFDSFTLDSFAKQIVDRFYPALPMEWRPKANFLVRTSSISINDAKTWFSSARVPEGVEKIDLSGRPNDVIKSTLDKVMHGVEIPYDQGLVHPLQRAWGLLWWREQLGLPTDQPSLTFPMINRLAAFLLRCNPKIRGALQQTYSHIFLDEFQDTTSAQWDLIKSAFLGSENVLTAVGDEKQRIMVWAGAESEIFDKFCSDFRADRTSLSRNYRSCPELVRIQHSIARLLDSNAEHPEISGKHEGEGGCSILEFDNPLSEAAYLADFISGEILLGAKPRDFCVINRQNTGVMIKALQIALAEKGLIIRDENLLQDLRAEPISNVVVLSMRLAASGRDPEAWSALNQEVANLTGLDEELQGAKLELVVAKHREYASSALLDGGGIRELPEKIVSIIGEDAYRNRYRQYSTREYFSRVLNDLGSALEESAKSSSKPHDVVRDFTGEDVIPAMSIHKSKGLEFGTVIFIGLEDEQWWNFSNQEEEEKRAFFVAFSRAINRVIFTCSNEREKFGRMSRTNRKNVGALFDALIKAGVPFQKV